MKQNIKQICKLGFVALIAAMPLAASAQNLQSGYFDDNYLYRFQANPAFGNEGHGFVAMPGLGNLNLGTNGTLGLDNIFYNINGQTTTLLNPGISASEAMSNIKDKNRLGVNLRETVLAFGFSGLGGYNTFSVNARANVGLSLPGDVFRLAKEGLSNREYDLSNTLAHGMGWAELSLGHSHKINSKLRVGANLKFLMGVASMETDIKTANLQLREDQWVGNVDASIYGDIKGMRYETDYNKDTKRYYVDGVEVDDFSPVNGFGLAVDLGAVYTFNSDWEFSASLLDLGFISWSNSREASSRGLQSVSTDSFAFNVDNNDSWDKFVDNLADLYQLEDMGDNGGRSTSLAATMNLAAQYTLPMYRKAKFGLLNTTCFNGPFTWTEFRLSANLEPVKALSLGANVGMGTFGFSFGWIINLKAPGFNLFVASDHTPGKLAKQGVPLNSNMNVNFGINFPF